jgi:hypothetical protein
MFHNHPNVFQLSFIIFNLKKDPLMETGIIQVDVVNINNLSQSIVKCIDIKEKIKEAENALIFVRYPTTKFCKIQ